MTTDLTIGKSYKVDSRRKGVFKGVVTHCDETWATVLITHGKAEAMLDYNEREQGESVTVRRAFCTFIELEGGAA